MPLYITASSQADAERKAEAVVRREIEAAWQRTAGRARTLDELSDQLGQFERELTRRFR